MNVRTAFPGATGGIPVCRRLATGGASHTLSEASVRMSFKIPKEVKDPLVPEDVLERLSEVESRHAGMTRLPPQIGTTTRRAVTLDQVKRALLAEGLSAPQVSRILSKLDAA